MLIVGVVLLILLLVILMIVTDIQVTLVVLASSFVLGLVPLYMVWMASFLHSYLAESLTYYDNRIEIEEIVYEEIDLVSYENIGDIEQKDCIYILLEEVARLRDIIYNLLEE